MIKDVEVFMWGKRIALLHQNSIESPALFEYDKNFVDSGIEVAPFMMPLSSKLYSFQGLSEESFHGLPGMIADSLPDRFGNAVIDNWLASTGRNPESFTALDRLCYTGTRGMGALEYVPATGPDCSGDSIDVSEMMKLASRVLENRKDSILKEDEANMAQLLEIGSSAGGARAKAVIAWNEETGDIKSGQINAGEGYRYWLLKFGDVAGNGDHGLKDDKQYTQIEYAYYLMALDLGIEMKECRLYEKDGAKHFMTERFDRVANKKIYMQTLAALIHSDYNLPGSCSYEVYADYARRLGIELSGIQQIYKRMVFSVLGMNCDDHVKNFSFTMDRRGKWSLAPAYDITFAYNPANRWISGHQMTISGKRTEITQEDMLLCGKKMGLKTTFCKEVIDRTKDTVLNWVEYADKAQISEERTVIIDSVIKRGII